jgi:hypothetical protein
MSLKGIISISGVPGLYKVLAQTKSGFIVESLNDKKRMPVASTQRISMLSDISVFTTTDDLPLRDVMMKLLEHVEKHDLADPKADPDKLRKFFKTVVPDYDSERVYPSDIKKILTWFQLVKDVVAIEDEPEEVASEEPAAEPEPETLPEKKSAAPAAKKTKKAAEEKSEKTAPKTRKKSAPK